MSRRRRLRPPLLGLVGLLVVNACLSDPATPPPESPTDRPSSAPSLVGPSATPSATPVPTPSPGPRAVTADTLVILTPDHPARLLPDDYLNPTEQLLVDLLYDPLYRLDDTVSPVPELARALPEVSDDGLTWQIPVKSDARFHSGRKLRPADVAFSLRMAKSASCPLGLTLCQAVRTYMANVSAGDGVATIELTEPYAPFLAEVLARLPIMSELDVKAATRDLVAAADRINEQRPDAVISEITDQMLRDACYSDQPPDGCLLRDHRAQLERIFQRARVDLPSTEPYLDATGLFDEDAYLGDLLQRLEALAQVFDSDAQDKNSAALGLLDPTAAAFGGGPYQLDHVGDDGTYYLDANPDHTRSVAKIPHLEIRVESDPAVASTMLLNREADWILETNKDQARVIDAVPGFRAASRALDTQFGVLFNVRPGHVYFDVDTRRAFVMCIDHQGLATATDPERHLATTPFTDSSWAKPEASLRERDVAAANALLEHDGWQMATDGIRMRDDGTRLATTIAVRPTSVDLFTFANRAAEQLKECGIGLDVEELDLTGDAMLRQLVYPNDFDTILWSRRLGYDPDSAVRVFESSRITTADNAADENPSGFTSELVDHYVASARATLDVDVRKDAYAKVEQELETLIPYWPLWYDDTVSAVSDRIHGPDRPIDPSRPRYDWDVSSWSLTPVRGR